VAAPAPRAASTPAPKHTTTTTKNTARHTAARAQVRRAGPRRQPPRVRAVTPAPSASAADRLVVATGIVTALSLAVVGGT
jgi:hypothetical protein